MKALNDAAECYLEKDAEELIGKYIIGNYYELSIYRQTPSITYRHDAIYIVMFLDKVLFI